MVALVVLAMPVNGGFYLEFVNYDPQGDDQHWERYFTNYVYQHTSGLLLGQALSLALGCLLTHRRGVRGALMIAVPLATALAAVTVTVALLLAPGPGSYDFTLPWAVIGIELAAYPLAALAGVGLGALTATMRPRPRTALVAAGVVVALMWLVVMLAGLTATRTSGPPAWLLLCVPPLAAATALGRATMSPDMWSAPADIQSDWGGTASIALLSGLTGYAVVLMLIARFRRRRLPSGTSNPPS